MWAVSRSCDVKAVWCYLLVVELVGIVCAMRLIVVFYRMCCYVCRMSKFAPQSLGASLGLDERVRRPMDDNKTCGLSMFRAVLAGFGADCARGVVM